MSRRTARPFWADDLPAYPGPAGNIPLDGTPDGVVALTLLHWREALRSRPLVYVARSDARAERIARTLSAFGDRAVFLPGWDCQPYDRVSPSRGAMGMRIAALHALQEPAGRVVVTTARAAMQRLPSRAEQLQQGMIIAPGRALDESALRTFLRGRGYVLDDRVDEPGEAAFHGRTIDIFPGNAEFPVRIECEDGLVKELRCYDPVLQRTLASLEQLDLLPTDEALAATPALSGELREALWDSERGTLRLGASHWLPLFYRHRLATLFEIAGDVAVLIDAEVPAQVDEHDRRIADAFAFAADLLRSERRQGSRTLSPLEPKRLYLERSEIEEALSDAVTFRLPADTSGKIGEHLPPLRANGRAGKARAFIGEQRAAGRRVLLAAEDEATRSALIARLRLDVLGIEQLKQWSDAVELRAGTVALLPEDLPQGFMLQSLCVIPAEAVLGPAYDNRDLNTAIGPEALQIGDRVVHIDHGIGILAGLETRAAETSEEHLAIDYADGRLLVPMQELDRVWRYGSDPDVPLDRLRGGNWPQQKAELLRAIEETAAGLAKREAARAQEKAAMIVAPRKAYDRFCARFTHELTPDQDSAIQDVLADLATGQRMDRLICGDVGFGKTEIALRAAAAALFSGYQVAFVAPTTVLVGQHTRTLRDRFAGFDVEIGELSRLTKPADTRRIKEGLRQGTIGIVVGTHAVISPSVRFKNLALTIIDEEQRFGVRQKAALERKRRSSHALAMSATPIPRTLQAAMAGVRSCSVLRTPPVRRQATRTFVLPWSDDLLREALLRESRRGGSSFVVCPRIADLPEMTARLAKLVPDLRIASAHGRLPPADIDSVILGFARGNIDVLVSTDIVESGLDIPRANTMIVHGADRFGLSQLHQLRGRVGRGRRRGICYFLVSPTAKQESLSRLRALEAAQQLGAGFEVSAADLDRRGAGDLLGLEQAGHSRLIGTELYRHLLGRAVEKTRGDVRVEAPLPAIELGIGGAIPASYVAEPEQRIALYRRFAAARSLADVEALAEEIDDRFGDPPREVHVLLAVCRLRATARNAGIAEIKGGPGGVAIRFRDDSRGAWSQRSIRDWSWQDDRLVCKGAFAQAQQRLDVATALVAQAGHELAAA